MGTNSISFSLGGGPKRGPVGKMGLNIKTPQKTALASAVFGVDDSDTEEQEVVDHNAKRQRVESSGLAFINGLRYFEYGRRKCKS